uniref:Uncharacterized protein n=1 Tax=viral metagenome TaxID=1070528 RepID=A0A6C0LGF6_9ZZZZ
MLSPDVENILEIQKKRSFREEQLKEKIQKSVKEKINNYANFGQTNCIYTIPSFIIGEIPFKLEAINKFLVRKLKSDGLYIINISLQHIYISWNIKDIQKAMEEKSKKNKIKSEKEDLNNYSAFVNYSKKTF